MLRKKNFKEVKEDKVKSSQIEDEELSQKSVEPTRYQIFLGTYTGQVLIINSDLNDKDQTFSFKASDSQIKTILPFENYIFTSGTDEIIRFYDLKNKQEKGVVVSYTGTIGKLFLNSKFLFAMSEKNIEIFKKKDLKKYAQLVGHKHNVIDFIVHSSGKIIFTIGRDNYLMLFSIFSKKPKFRYKFDSELAALCFCYNEKYLAISFSTKVLILDYQVDSENFDDWIVLDHKISSSFDNPSKILDTKNFNNKYLLIVKTNFEVEIVKLNKLDNNKKLIKLKLKSKSEGKRIKNFTVVESDIQDLPSLLLVIDSDNLISVFNLDILVKSKEVELEAIKQFDLAADRFTAISAVLSN